MFEALDLARFQFAFVVSFHIIFPAFTIGLASYLAVLEGLWLWKKEDRYLELFRYWLKIFAVAFGMGVVSGIVMSYQFGTNWSVFSDKTGPVLGPLMGYEVLSAFFLEAGFLGIMLFGLNRVGKQLHFFATLMVAFGTFFSAFWILSVNSWMHTPAGFDINSVGQFVPVNWLEIIFNPSFPYRLVHMLMAAYLTTAFVVVAVGSFHLVREKKDATNARTMTSMGLWMIAIVAPLQLIAGDMHGLNTLEHQPAKVAAMEGHYETKSGAPLILFGFPDDEKEQVSYELSIPKLGSLILKHDPDGEVKGLKEWPKEERPPAEIIFYSFRLMVGIGMLMILIGIVSLWLRFKKRLFHASWFHRALIFTGPLGFIAVIAGWVTTEVGRQPYTVYGLLTTAQSVSPIDTLAVSLSLLTFIVTYFVIFGAGVIYLFRQFRVDPDSIELSNEEVRQAGSVKNIIHFVERVRS
jgi:cytochrome d ubiquinol oxidase subunit I